MSFINITNRLIHRFVLFAYKTRLLVRDIHFVRPERIELSSHPWQGRVLPLNHDRILKNLILLYSFIQTNAITKLACKIRIVC